MKRVLIIGNCGSGKTTFARTLAEKTGLRLVHLDKLFWHGNWQHVTPQEMDVLLQDELDKESWILDGNFNRTLPRRLAYCDTVFFFDLPVLTCLIGVLKRTWQNRGKTRDDMGGFCPEYFDKNKLRLFKNIIQFNKTHRKDYGKLLENTKTANVIRFRRRSDIRQYLITIASSSIKE